MAMAISSPAWSRSAPVTLNHPLTRGEIKARGFAFAVCQDHGHSQRPSPRQPTPSSSRILPMTLPSHHHQRHPSSRPSLHRCGAFIFYARPNDPPAQGRTCYCPFSILRLSTETLGPLEDPRDSIKVPPPWLVVCDGVAPTSHHASMIPQGVHPPGWLASCHIARTTSTR